MSHFRQGVAGLCVFVLALGSARGEDKPPVPRAAPPEVTTVFRDGSVLRSVGLSGRVELTTRYGKLSVPLADVKRIEFGFRIPEADARKIEQAITLLRSNKDEDRTEARGQLVSLGAKAAPALRIAARDKDDAFACRAGAILEAIQKAVPADQLQGRMHDVVVTSDGIFIGRLTTEGLMVKTKTLGEVQLKLTDLRSLHAPGDQPEQPVTVPTGATTGAPLGTGAGATTGALSGTPITPVPR
ncbi:MAG TPA: hypothetical protein VKD72_27460 [Gemmataceae bacterium]|nr:hypothetical protein [Gemmataceae bacterium]